jgi:Uma2 family endonuclease
VVKLTLAKLRQHVVPSEDLMTTLASIEAKVPARDLQDEPLFEILDGLKVEISHMSAFASIIASRLLGRLHFFLMSAPLGEAVMETLFHLALPKDRNRRPDVAFVSFERWPRSRPREMDENAWDVVPDLAVEVVSPHDLTEELQDKIDEYFRAGVRLVWVIYPKHARIHMYQSPSRVRALCRSDTLEGGDVLPQFRLSLTELFLEDSAP